MRIVPNVVYLVHWHHPVYGDRWSLARDDRPTDPLVTRGTELEARQVAREYGWTVTKTGETLGKGAS